MFHHKLDSDFRTPIVTFSIQAGSAPWSWFDTSRISGTGDNVNGEDDTVRLGLVISSIEFWKQMAAAMTINIIVGSLIASIVHSYIIKKRGSSTALVIGYGIIIPFLFTIPHYIIKWLDIRNSVPILVIGGAFALQGLRCITAIHGTTTPQSVEKKRLSYCVYFCTIVDMEYDKRTGDFVYVKYKYYEAWKKLKIFLFGVVKLGFMYSIMEVLEYKPFMDYDNDSDNSGDDYYYLYNNHWKYLHWKHLINNFCFAYIWHLCLLTGSTAFEFALALFTGIKTKPLTINPLLGSASVSDFWGRQWNNVVHKVLKDSVYRPMIPHFKPTITAIAVFFVSGLLHEYILFICDLSFARTGRKNVSIMYGLQTIFFLWNAGVLLCEYVVSQNQFIQVMSSRLPRIVVSLLVVITVLPISHWFSEGMQEIPILLDYKLGYPMFVIVQE